MLPGLCLTVQLRRGKTERERIFINPSSPVSGRIILVMISIRIISLVFSMHQARHAHAAHLTCTSRSLYVSAAHAGALTISVWQMIDRWFYSPSERKASK